MDEAQSNYMNIDNQGHYSSTDLPRDIEFDFAEEVDLTKVYHFGEEEADLSNIFDFGEEEDLSKIFDFPQEQPVNTTIILSTSVENSSPNRYRNSENISELPNIIPKEKQPMTTTNCPSYSSIDKNSSRITYQINHDGDDDYSLSYIYSKGLNNVSMLQEEGGTTSDGINQEDPKNFIPKPIVIEKQGDTINMSRRREQENPNTNDMILQQPLPKIPILEKLERESSLKLKSTIDQPLRISTDFRKEEENPKAKDPHMPKNPRLERGFMKSTYHSNFEILEQEKLMILNQKSDFMKPTFLMNHPHGMSTSMRAKEHENPKTDGMILQRPMPHILTLEKLESHLMKSKLMLGQENGIFKQQIDSDGYGILSSLDNESQQKKSTNGGPIRRSPNETSSRYQPFGREIDPNNHLEALFGRSSNPVNYSNNNFQRSPAYTHEITNGDGAPDLLQSSWVQAQDSHFKTTTNWPSVPFH